MKPPPTTMEVNRSKLEAGDSKVVFVVVFGILVLNCFTEFGTDAQTQTLAPDEVKALEAINSSLKGLNWKINGNFCSEVRSFTKSTVDDSVSNVTCLKINGNFCSEVTSFTKSTVVDGLISNVTCNCNGTFCSITNIVLKRLNLTGVLPAEFGNLPNLRELDLTFNYISGSIPTSFSQLPLVILSLSGNRLNGTIPNEIGEIGSLEKLVLEANELGGPLPESLGNLTNLKRLVLNANNFTGEIPKTFGKLKNLTEFRIDGTMISGTIPDFIGNWAKLQKLMISDLKGSSIGFPNLQGFDKLGIFDAKKLLNQ
uniref:Leucine-rich repeat-containing N-terminal plant-type domain-containing protein n=1 Tax=Fagus sylvatica TaxID=28930 RepID=A0A2N9IL77_FAGSY